MTTPAQRRQAARQLATQGLSQRRACRVVGLARSSYAKPVGEGRGSLRPADAELVAALQALVTRHAGWGCWKYHYRLRKKGMVVNQKRLSCRRRAC